MKVMLTLFHHSLPPWAGKYGGWKMEKTVNYFMDFVRYFFWHWPLDTFFIGMFFSLLALEL
jgi:beta-glucosidase/6-phospho-beta-glucosidase/beta-galactosidase